MSDSSRDLRSDADAATPKSAAPDDDWCWWAGRDEEWFTEGPFKSREEAVEAGEGIAEDYGLDQFCIIEAVQGAVSFSAERLIEAQYAEDDDNFDYDHSEPGRLGDHAAADAELQALLDAWTDKYRHTFVTPGLFLKQRNREFLLLADGAGHGTASTTDASQVPGSTS
jgi:hypothetical protein